MLLAPGPPALVHAPVRPLVNAIPIFFVVVVLAVVAYAIRINVDPIAMHVVADPVAVILSTIVPQICAEAMNLVVDPFANKRTPICPHVLADAFFLAVHEIAFIRASLLERLFPFALLQVVGPLAHVFRVFCCACVGALPVLLVVVPVAFVGIPASKEKFTVPESLVILPFAFIAGAIRPNNFSEPMPHATLPLALVHSSSLVAVLVFLEGGSLVVSPMESLARLLGLEVLANALLGQLHHPVLASLQECPHHRLHPDQQHHVFCVCLWLGAVLYETL